MPQPVTVDLSIALRTLNHELRTPAGVIQGYIKLLLDGRVDAEHRESVLVQMQRAAARIAQIGQQSSELLHWISDAADDPATEVPIAALVERLRATASGTVALAIVVAPQCAADTIRTSSADAVVRTVVTLAEAASRRSGPDITAAIRPMENGVGIDVCVFPTPPDGSSARVVCAKHRTAVDMHQGGLGLSMFIAAAVAHAHGGSIWQQADGPMLGATFPWSDES